MSDMLLITKINIMPIPDTDDYLVEAIDNDGGVHRAIFSGSQAGAQAYQWANTAYPGGITPTLVGPHTYLGARPRPKLTLVRPLPDGGGR